MGLLGFGKRAEKFLAVVTFEGPGRLRLNGVKVRDEKTKQAALKHERTLCWVELDPDGVRRDQGVGRAATQAGAGQAERLLRDLSAMPPFRAVLDRLREGQESVGKWLQLAEPVAGRR